MNLKTCSFREGEGYFYETEHFPLTYAQLPDAGLFGGGESLRVDKKIVSTPEWFELYPYIQNNGSLVFHYTDNVDDHEVFFEGGVQGASAIYGHATWSYDSKPYRWSSGCTPDGRGIFWDDNTGEILLASQVLDKTGGPIEFSKSFGLVPLQDESQYLSNVYCSDKFLYAVAYSDNDGRYKIFKSSMSGGGFEYTGDVSREFSYELNSFNSTPLQGPWMLYEGPWVPYVGSKKYVCNMDTGGVFEAPENEQIVSLDGRFLVSVVGEDFDDAESDILLRDLSISTNFNENITRVIHSELRRDYIVGVAPVVSRESGGYHKVFLHCELWDNVKLLMVADEAGCLYYSLHRDSIFNAVGWPASEESPPPRFWTSLVGCSEKP